MAWEISALRMTSVKQHAPNCTRFTTRVVQIARELHLPVCRWAEDWLPYQEALKGEHRLCYILCGDSKRAGLSYSLYAAAAQ